MKKVSIIILLIIVGFMQDILIAQTFKDRYYTAEDYVEDQNYQRAIYIYSALLNESHDNANLNFKLGYCYVHLATQNKKAIAYLEFASKYISKDYNSNSYKTKSAPLETLFYLGRAYHLNYEFNKAERAFLEIQGKIDKNDVEFNRSINHELDACKVAKELIKSPIDIKITNVGKSINTKFDEHSPLISGDNKTLIFTSKQKGSTGNKQTFDGQYFEDIYISYFDGKEFVKAQKISSNINTDGHDACSGLSHDGTQLLLFTSKHDGALSISKKDSSGWTVPKRLPGHINSKYRETSAALSNDNNTLYFTSDRKGGFGGLDIYKVDKLENGKWGKVENMGSKINTPYDEEGPYLSQTGKHFFFSSKGHENIGGFDIFVCALKDNGQWSAPENVGYPVNTPDDQVFETSTSDSKIFYISSRSHKGYGGDDIFRVDLPDNHISKIVKVLAAAEPIAEVDDNTPKLTDPNLITKNTITNHYSKSIHKDSIGKTTSKVVEVETIIVLEEITDSKSTGKSKQCWYLFVLLILGIVIMYFTSKRK